MGKTGAALIGQVYQIGQVSTTSGCSFLRILLASPFGRPTPTPAGVMVVPCSQPPLSASGIVFALEDVHIAELHAVARYGNYHFTPLRCSW